MCDKYFFGRIFMKLIIAELKQLKLYKHIDNSIIYSQRIVSKFNF